MKTAYLVEISLMVRVEIEHDQINSPKTHKEAFQKISEAIKGKVIELANNGDLAENITDWYEDKECPAQN